MAVLRGLLTLAALLGFACLPCLVAVVFTADAIILPIARAVRRVRRGWAERRLAHRAGLRMHRGVLRRTTAAPAGPPIEKLAADLRRLARQRVGIATHSPVWAAAVTHAYDDRLATACRELEIPEHLGELAGLDLEIERVRVEGLIEAAGLGLPSVDADRRQQDQR
ncbi:MAG: hypothetical protein J2P15_19490 [Micromonosporaceae bacterium]|nr:hypothetical protein [Micromonosporaceae bacterium]